MLKKIKSPHITEQTGSVCTLLKSGGGFLPLHRLDKAHTALRVVVRRLDFASNLQKQTYTQPDK